MIYLLLTACCAVVYAAFSVNRMVTQSCDRHDASVQKLCDDLEKLIKAIESRDLLKATKGKQGWGDM